jgi:putative chitinase
MITAEQLKQICVTNNGKTKAVEYAPLLNEILPKWEINTPARVAMFLSQVLHESMEFLFLKELGNNSYLAKYDTGNLAAKLGNTPDADGDGQLYRGRGLIQITGKDNYRKCGQALQLPLLKNPELLEMPRNAIASACWFWQSKDLNRHADHAGITACSIAVNGGTNGLDKRKAYWYKALAVLSSK